MRLAILGRQPNLGLAELERVFSPTKVQQLNHATASFEASVFDIQNFGGLLKAGEIVDCLTSSSWDSLVKKITSHFLTQWENNPHKITLGISVYNYPIDTKEIQKLALNLKKQLKKNNVSLRVVPNAEPALNTATSHHNKLGLNPNKIELLITKTNQQKLIVANSTGAQNITAYQQRDQARPKRDAFVGMLPPKLAQIMLNLALGQSQTKNPTILDPFCGTGVILQEALLMGYSVIGTDLSQKMIDYSQVNLNWLAKNHHLNGHHQLHQADATNATWHHQFTHVVSETYLGQPLSGYPSQDKLVAIRQNCNHLISQFLKNISTQAPAGTLFCLAVPAWKKPDGSFDTLSILDNLTKFKLKTIKLNLTDTNQLLYFRDDQIVARKLLILEKTN